jgi:hypothetical protein
MIENIKRVTKVTGKKDAMRTNYMMTVDDVMEELGVKRSKAYSILKQLNDELAKEGCGSSWKDSTSLLGNKILWMLSASSLKEGLECQLTRTQNREPGM